MGFRDDLNDDMVKNHLNPDEFGEMVQYIPSSGQAVTIPAAYDEAPVAVDAGAEVASIGYRPRLIFRTIDMPTGCPGKGDKVTLTANDWHKAGTWRVVDFLNSRLGEIEVFLQEGKA